MRKRKEYEQNKYSLSKIYVWIWKYFIQNTVQLLITGFEKDEILLLTLFIYLSLFEYNKYFKLNWGFYSYIDSHLYI